MGLKRIAGGIFFLTLLLNPFNRAQAWELSDHLFGGIGGGQSELDTGLTSLTGSATLNEKDGGYRIFGGIRFCKFFSVESGFHDLGEATFQGNSGDTFKDENGFQWTVLANNSKFTIDARTVTLGGTAYLPLGQIFRVKWLDTFAPFATAGGHHWKGRINFNTQGFTPASSKDNDFDIYYGGGLQLDFPYRFGLRFEWNRYNIDADISLDHVDFTSFNVIFPF